MELEEYDEFSKSVEDAFPSTADKARHLFATFLYYRFISSDR